MTCSPAPDRYVSNLNKESCELNQISWTCSLLLFFCPKVTTWVTMDLHPSTSTDSRGISSTWSPSHSRWSVSHNVTASINHNLSTFPGAVLMCRNSLKRRLSWWWWGLVLPACTHLKCWCCSAWHWNNCGGFTTAFLLLTEINPRLTSRACAVRMSSRDGCCSIRFRCKQMVGFLCQRCLNADDSFDFSNCVCLFGQTHCDVLMFPSPSLRITLI